MAFNNYGLTQLGSFMKGDSPSSPDYVEFGEIGSSQIYSNSYLYSGIMRNSITWTWLNTIDIRGYATLNYNDAIGSTILELGLGTGSTVGSTIYARETSTIGDKTATESFAIQFDVVPRRA